MLTIAWEIIAFIAVVIAGMVWGLLSGIWELIRYIRDFIARYKSQ